MAIKLKKVKNQVVVVTGASSGIGLATAELLGENGASVVLAARSDETLDEIVARIIAKGGKAVAVTCDVTNAPRSIISPKRPCASSAESTRG